MGAVDDVNADDGSKKDGSVSRSMVAGSVFLVFQAIGTDYVHGVRVNVYRGRVREVLEVLGIGL